MKGLKAIPIDNLYVSVISNEDTPTEETVALIMYNSDSPIPLVVQLTEEGIGELIDELKAHQADLYPKGVFQRFNKRKHLLQKAGRVSRTANRE